MRIHKPVLLQEAVTLLNCRSGGLYVDCTAGMAGHSEEILKASAPDGRLLAMDRDEQAIAIIRQKLEPYSNRVTIIHSDYRRIRNVLEEYSITQVDGILADLGVSMLQFSDPQRGFSFQEEGPLDMRMDQSQKETAEDLIRRSSEQDLSRILKEFGEEPAAKRIARAIVQERKNKPIQTTTDLRMIIEKVVPIRRTQRIHPATLTFQALRIAVNRELEGLDQFLFDAFDVLANGGRLVIIAFHSLEDRTVKQVFRFLSAACRCSIALPVCQCGGKPLSKLLTPSPVRPTEDEVNENPPSRSAKLRAIEKIEGTVPRELWQTWINEHQNWKRNR
ncbi:MAG TPA: 16S rRNA (cytosine(1402)-N(4))-methyltransferase RsmH [Acidobacteriota bacterium]|nr:16S rRNA (cytosine(1402)-N(4))-methyltransferase RsmH [Acidobacteriota bacterium]